MSFRPTSVILRKGAFSSISFRVTLVSPGVVGRAVLLLAVVFGLSGCGQPGGRLPVSGRVTFKGQPLSGGAIEFVPAEQADLGAAGGAVVQGGQYALPREHGLESGKYKVKISFTEELRGVKTDSPSLPTRERIPPEFNAQTTQVIEVTPKGTNRFDFDIPTEAPRR